MITWKWSVMPGGIWLFTDSRPLKPGKRADPRTISFDWENSADKTTCSYGAENIFYLPLAWYGLRWNIKVSYYEGRTFWSMEVMKAFLDISPPVPRKPDTKLVSKFSQI
ncbi:MAG: hypothetical protein HFG52_09460 [Lachnospiraceae bacterium]|nr:hypothetical protein [Lachnospiraceae bacterium]